MKINLPLVLIILFSVTYTAYGLCQSAQPGDRKQAREEIEVIKSRINNWGLPTEYYRIDDEKAFEDVILFIQDPVSRFDSIRYLNSHQLWNYIGIYNSVLKGSKGMGSFYFFDHLKEILIPVDDKKVKLVTYLMHDRQPDGAYAELIIEIYTRLFAVNPLLFVDDLKARANWKDIIGSLGSGDYDAMAAGLKKLGNTKFETELKEYWAECLKKWYSIR